MFRKPLIVVQVKNPSLSVSAQGFFLLSQLTRLQQSKFNIMVVCSTETAALLPRIEKAGFPIFATDQCWIAAIQACIRETDCTDVIIVDDSQPLIDPFLIQKTHHFHCGGIQDVTICTRLMPGTEIQCISRGVLLDLLCMPGEATGLHIKEFLPSYEYQYHFRLALEDYEDLLFHRVLSSFLGANPGTLDITNFLRQHRELCQINRRPMISILLEDEGLGGQCREECFQSLAEQRFQSFEVIPNDPDMFMSLMASTVADKVSSSPRGQYQLTLNTSDKLSPDALSFLFTEIGNNGTATCGWFECNSRLEVIKEELDVKDGYCCLVSRKPYKGGHTTHIRKALFFLRGRA